MKINNRCLHLVGSGSTYVYGYCDATYQEGWNEEQTVQFVRNSKSNTYSKHPPLSNVLAIYSVSSKPLRSPCPETVRQEARSVCASSPKMALNDTLFLGTSFRDSGRARRLLVPRRRKSLPPAMSSQCKSNRRECWTRCTLNLYTKSTTL